MSNQRSARAALGKQTIEILEAGEYSLPDGRVVKIADERDRCLSATRIFEPDELSALRDRAFASDPKFAKTTIEVRNETTLAGAAREAESVGGDRVDVLNFASARNPGGGFLGGSQAQEESLARSSALYASQQRVFEFYEFHRNADSLLYSDRMILSPHCLVFRNDNGQLLERPFAVTFITSPAPNAGAVQQNQPHNQPLIAGTLARRAELVLALAAHHGCETLILGAWGCGVFRNDPAHVAATFAQLLLPGKPWHGRFAKVLFSVLDTAERPTTYLAFRDAFA